LGWLRYFDKIFFILNHGTFWLAIRYRKLAEIVHDLTMVSS